MTMDFPTTSPPNGMQPILLSGNTDTPTQALVLMHGRGGNAQDFLQFAMRLAVPADTVIVAPQAEGSTWYPQRFIVSQAANQPELDSALNRIDAILRTLKEQFAIDSQQVTLGGFSQGACLVAEFLKRNPERYRGAAIMSGGLIGNEAEVAIDVPGSLSGTPLYLGCDEDDLHIPNERVRDTAEYFTRHGAEVSSPLYQGLGHAIHPDAIAFIESVLKQ